MSVLLGIFVVIVFAVLVLASASVKQVQQYQRGVVLRFGRLLPSTREPGLRVIVPFADRMTKVSLRTVVLDIPAQSAITRDNVSVGVDAVVYFRVEDPVKSVINVENYLQATSQVARTSLRSVIGRADLDTLLSDREQINGELKAVLDAPTEDWGIAIDRVEVKDISLPEGMRRSMSRQAEAERERRARVIVADAELQASAKLAQAADAMAHTPGALQLRMLQTVVDVASEKNSTLVMPFPVELLRFFDRSTSADVPRGGDTRTSAPAALPSDDAPASREAAAPGEALVPGAVPPSTVPPSTVPPSTVPPSAVPRSAVTTGAVSGAGGKPANGVAVPDPGHGNGQPTATTDSPVDPE